MRRAVPAIAALLVLAAPVPARAAVGDIIVQRDPGLDRSERAEIRSDADVKLVATLPVARTEVVKPAPGQQAEALAALRADDDVAYAEPDTAVHSTRTPSDSFWSWQWALSNAGQGVAGLLGAGTPGADIDASVAWDRTQGAGVTVAVVDTGVDADHVDMAGQITGDPDEIGRGRESNGVDDDANNYTDDYRGWDFVSNDNDPSDQNGHGTHVAGIIAALADNHVGIAGVAPQAKIMPLRALDANGSGSMSNVAAAFAYAGDLGVRIVNASLAGGYSQTLRNVIAAHPNTLYVVAAGNEHANDDDATVADYPCALPLANIVCVGATDNQDNPASFSNFGPTSVDLSAPGVAIVSDYFTSPTSLVFMDGTSMASPHVAGAAALALSADPAATTAQLRHALLSSVDTKPALSGRTVTGGRLNADAAVTAVLSPWSEPVPTPTPVATPPAPPTPITAEPVPPAAPVPAPVPPAPVAAPAPPPAPVLPAPRLSRLSIGGSLASPSGTLRISFLLNRPAGVRFAVTTRSGGHRVGAWTQHFAAGANVARVGRRLPTHRTLAPGAYRVTVGVGAGAGARSASFTVSR